MALLLMVLMSVIMVQTVKADLMCLKCSGVKNIDQCMNNRIRCGVGEKCFLEKVTSDNLEIEYNAGCRSDIVCKFMVGLGATLGKRSLVNCGQCCSDQPDGNGTPCNAGLCGLIPNVTNVNRCLACKEGLDDPSVCEQRTICQVTEVCYNSIEAQGGVIKHKFGCKDRYICREFINNGISGKRSNGIEICSACCYGNECNKEDCFSLRRKMNATSLGLNPGETNKPVQGASQTTPQPTLSVTAQQTTIPVTQSTKNQLTTPRQPQQSTHNAQHSTPKPQRTTQLPQQTTQPPQQQTTQLQQQQTTQPLQQHSTQPPKQTTQPPQQTTQPPQQTTQPPQQTTQPPQQQTTQPPQQTTQSPQQQTTQPPQQTTQPPQQTTQSQQQTT